MIMRVRSADRRCFATDWDLGLGEDSRVWVSSIEVLALLRCIETRH